VWRCCSDTDRPAVETFCMNGRIATVRSATDDSVVWSITYQLKTLCYGSIKIAGIWRLVLKMEIESVVTAGYVKIDMCFV